VAAALAGPYASLHLASDRQPRQHPTTLFLQAERPSCRPTNSVKALKANTATQQRKHKYKKAKTTTQSITVVDTLYWSINKISYYYHLCSPNLIAYVSHIDTKLAKTIHRGNVSKYNLSCLLLRSQLGRSIAK